jgi:hypothetical protein
LYDGSEAQARLKANEKDDAIQAYWNASKSFVPWRRFVFTLLVLVV